MFDKQITRDGADLLNNDVVDSQVLPSNIKPNNQANPSTFINNLSINSKI